MEQLVELLPVLLPILAIDFGFKIYSLIDILRQDRVVRWNNKVVWIIIAVLVNFGWIIYFFFGREE